MKKSKLALLLATVVTLGFMGCEQPESEPPHEHFFSKEWSSDGEKHWHECKCGAKNEEADHSFTWVASDSSTHWKECECGKKVEKAEHNFIHKGNSWQECECSKKIPVSLDVLGTYDSIKITFGVYPQTIKASDVTVDKTVKNNEISGADYYLGSDGAWYVECVENAFPLNSKKKYSDGNIVAEKSANSVKYFKVEPIEWGYLEVPKCLLAKKILTGNVRWTDGSISSSDDKYENSNIRRWLNGTFYDSAFTENQKKKIKTTVVDNWTIKNQYDTYSQEQTQEQIFLLSSYEVRQPLNGFPNTLSACGKGNSRIKFPTDYALANDCEKDSDSSYGGNWWLRILKDGEAEFVKYDGNAYCYVYDGRDPNTGKGIVPALSIDE